MKIIFEESDLKRIESLRKSKESGKDNSLSILQDGKEYSISFEVIDSVKANAFILEFMRTDEVGRRMIEEAVGIRAKKVLKTSVETKLDHLRELITEFEHQAKEILK